MKRVCKYVYDIGDQACSKLCDPNGGQLKKCMRNCTDYFMEYHNRIMPDPRPCPGFQYYVDGTETCEPCEEICNPIASLEGCKLSCPEYFKYYTSSNEAGVREDTCSCDDVILALSILTFLLSACLLLVAAYFIKGLRCRHCERHQVSEEAPHDQGSDVELSELISDPTGTSEYSSSGATDTKSLRFTNFEETEQPVTKEYSKSELVSEIGSFRSVGDIDSLCKHDPQSATHGDIPCEGNQQTRALENTTTVKSESTFSFQSPQASSSEDCETRPKESFLEPSPVTSTVSPLLSTNPSSYPLVSLDEGVPTYGISSDGSAGGTFGPSTMHENWNQPISPKDFQYLMHQEWVRVLLMVNRNRTEIEIMVNGIGLEDARRQITENTSLESSQYDLTTFVNCFAELLNGHEALDIANLIFFKPTQSLQLKDGPMVSTVGGYLERRGTDSIYLITSAHNSSKGTEYFCDPRMRPEDSIGKCKYWFYDDKLDIAFIQLEDYSSSKRPRNILSLPSDKPGVTIDYKPWLVDDPFSDRGRTRSRDLLKFSRKVDRGELCEIIKRDSCHLAMKSPPGEGSPGDSGSLVTSCHVKLSQQGKYLPAVGLASRKETLIRKTEDRYLVTEACIFTPIWPAVKKIAQIEGVHSTKFRFLEPGSRKWSGIQPVLKDTGYQSSPPKL